MKHEHEKLGRLVIEDETGLEGLEIGKVIKPKEALGEDFKGELPDGVRFYMRDQAALDALDEQDGVRWYLYRVKKAAGNAKHLLSYIGRCECRPEPDWIQETYGEGSYRWGAKWKNPEGREVGCYSQIIMIEGNPAATVTAAKPQADQGLGGVQMLEFSLILTERLAAVAKSMGGGNAAPVQAPNMEAFDRMTSKLGDAYERLMDKQLKAAEKMATLPAPEKKVERDEDDDVPGWLKPALPLIEKGFGYLTGNGPMAKMAAAEIATDEQFLAAFNDPEKWQTVIRVLAHKFGEEKVAKALDVLNGVKSLSKAMKK